MLAYYIDVSTFSDAFINKSDHIGHIEKHAICLFTQLALPSSFRQFDLDVTHYYTEGNDIDSDYFDFITCGLIWLPVV